MKAKIDWALTRDEIVERYGAGESTRQIASNYDVSHVTINKHLAEWKIARRNGDSHRHVGEIDLAGRRFGKLCVVARVEDSYPPRWLARCDCGRSIELGRSVLIKAYSCGCTRRRQRARVKRTAS